MIATCPAGEIRSGLHAAGQAQVRTLFPVTLSTPSLTIPNEPLPMTCAPIDYDVATAQVWRAHWCAHLAKLVVPAHVGRQELRGWKSHQSVLLLNLGELLLHLVVALLAQRRRPARRLVSAQEWSRGVTPTFVSRRYCTGRQIRLRQSPAHT